jgi:integrase
MSILIDGWCTSGERSSGSRVWGWSRPTKSRAGLRVLRLPGWLAGVLARRRRPVGGPVPVLPDATGGFRDRSNIERDFRRVREGTPFEWVVPHTYRKTVATFLDDGGLSARVVADQLGHARISMTQDVYMGRQVVHPAAASTLEALTGWSGADDNRVVTAAGAIPGAGQSRNKPLVRGFGRR